MADSSGGARTYEGLSEGLLALCERWQKSDPNNAWSWFYHGIADTQLGNLDQAIKSFSEGIRIRPDSPAAWYLLSVVYSLKRQFPIAKEAIQEALRLSPGEAEYWYRFGFISSQLEMADEAVNAYKKAIEISPQAKYWKGLGDAYKLKKLKRIVTDYNAPMGTRYDEIDRIVTDAYRQAVKLDQDYIDGWFALAQALTGENKCNEAQDAIVEIKKRDPVKGLEITSWYRRKSERVNDIETPGCINLVSKDWGFSWQRSPVWVG